MHQRGLLWAERAAIKEVKHAFKMSVPLLFYTNNTFQWLKREAEGGKNEVKEGRKGENSKKLSGAWKLRLGLCLSMAFATFMI